MTVTLIHFCSHAAGNTASGPKAGEEGTRLHFAYDGCNRMTAAYADDNGEPGAIIGTYEYDGAGRRIEKTAGGSTLDYFWNEAYQNIETRQNDDADPIDQTVYDIRYVDAPIVRFRDGNLDGDYVDAGDNTLYVMQDANFNVTGVVDASNGGVVERYAYAPYGERLILNAYFGLRSVSSYDWIVGHQGLAYDLETGLVYNRARYLHTSMGVFTIRDPMGYVDGPHLYHVTAGNPLAFADPSGLNKRTQTNDKHTKPRSGRMNEAKKLRKGWQHRGKPLDRRRPSGHHELIWLAIGVAAWNTFNDSVLAGEGYSSEDIGTALADVVPGSTLGRDLIGDNVVGGLVDALNPISVIVDFATPFSTSIVNITDTVYVAPMEDLIDRWNEGMPEHAESFSTVTPADVAQWYEERDRNARRAEEERVIMESPPEIADLKRIVVRCAPQGADCLQKCPTSVVGVGKTPALAVANAQNQVPGCCMPATYRKCDWVFVEYVDGTQIRFPSK